MNGKSLIGLMYREAVAILSKCNTSMVLIVCEGELTGLFVCVVVVVVVVVVVYVMSAANDSEDDVSPQTTNQGIYYLTPHR